MFSIRVVSFCLVLSMACMVIARPNPPISEVAIEDLPIGFLIEDYDGKEFHKQGSHSCWRSGGDKEPYLSKPIFKYCMYKAIANTTQPAVSGYNYNVDTDEHIDKVFAANPRQTVVFIADKLKLGSEKEAVHYFLCNTSGCNVALDVHKFFEFNARQGEIPDKWAF